MPLSGNIDGLVPQSYRFTATLAEIVAGTVKIPAKYGWCYRIRNVKAFVTGNFTTATDVRLSTNESTPTDVVTIAQASLTDGAILDSEDITDDALGTKLEAGYGIQVRYTGSTLAGGTSIDFEVSYTLEK